MKSNNGQDGLKYDSESETSRSKEVDENQTQGVSLKIYELPRLGDDLSNMVGPAPFEFKLEKFMHEKPKDRIGEGNLSDSGHLVEYDIAPSTNKLGRFKYIKV